RPPMPPLPEVLEKAREAGRRVDELEEQARRRQTWAAEADRLAHDVEAAERALGAAVHESERAQTEARGSRGFIGALKDRLAGNLPEGRADRLAQKEAAEQATAARRLAAEALLRRLEGEREEAR